MYLPAFTTPTDRARRTRVTSESPCKAADDRVWMIIHNPTAVAADVGLISDGGDPVAAFTLAPKASIVLPSPVWHGPIYLVEGKCVTVTEVLRHDADVTTR